MRAQDHRVKAGVAHLDDAVLPLDAARRALWATARRVPFFGRAMQSVASRVPLLAAVSVTVALTLTCFAPGLLFVLGPALLGVPHVASDVRYLVLRQRRPARWTVTIALGAAALIALRAVEMSAPRALPFALVEAVVGWAWIAMAIGIAAAASSSPARWLRAVLFALPIMAAAAAAIAHPGPARALLAYGHNAVAPLIWVVLFRGHKGRAVLPIALLVAGAGVLLSGVTIPWLRADDLWVGTLVQEARYALPMLGPGAALAVALSYVFLQAVHYSIWLVWIPQERIRGNATLTFRMSVRAAQRDFGAWGLGLVVGASLAMTIASVVAVHRTRHFYLSIATFHAYLELACLAFLWLRLEGATPLPGHGVDERAT